MHQYSTILFINDQPVGYKVLKDTNRIVLNPAENPGRTISTPVLYANENGGNWTVEGTSSQDLIQQVLSGIKNERNIPQQALSAAP